MLRGILGTSRRCSLLPAVARMAIRSTWSLPDRSGSNFPSQWTGTGIPSGMLIVSDLAMVSQFLILWRRIVLREKDRLPKSCPDAVARAPTVPIATRSETLNLSKVEVISAERKAVDFVLVSFLRFRGMGWVRYTSLSSVPSELEEGDNAKWSDRSEFCSFYIQLNVIISFNIPIRVQKHRIFT